MSVPNSVVHYVLTSNRRSLNTLERTIRCLVDVNYRKVDTAGNVQIEIIAKDVIFKIFLLKIIGLIGTSHQLIRGARSWSMKCKDYHLHL